MKLLRGHASKGVHLAWADGAAPCAAQPDLVCAGEGGGGRHRFGDDAARRSERGTIRLHSLGGFLGPGWPGEGAAVLRYVGDAGEKGGAWVTRPTVGQHLKQQSAVFIHRNHTAGHVKGRARMGLVQKADVVLAHHHGRARGGGESLGHTEA